jgi:hypothetical protein
MDWDGIKLVFECELKHLVRGLKLPKEHFVNGIASHTALIISYCCNWRQHTHPLMDSRRFTATSYVIRNHWCRNLKLPIGVRQGGHPVARQILENLDTKMVWRVVELGEDWQYCGHTYLTADYWYPHFLLCKWCKVTPDDTGGTLMQTGVARVFIVCCRLVLIYFSMLTSTGSESSTKGSFVAKGFICPSCMQSFKSQIALEVKHHFRKII